MKYLLSLVNQLMDFRKVESGKLEIVKTRGNFLKFIDSLITPFEVFAGERNIVLKRYYRMETPEILYDEEAMRKVVTNLLSNAIKFTPNGGTVSLYISSLSSGEGGMLHTFEINDEQEDFTRPWLEKSPFADKIRFYIGDALELVPRLGVTFDMAFIDGDKRKYIEYYEMTLAYLSEGGYIIADNTLWEGKR
jgi:hypothetical protein